MGVKVSRELQSLLDLRILRKKACYGSIMLLVIANYAQRVILKFKKIQNIFCG